MEQRLTGIILGKKDIGEADRIYTFYTLEKGKIQAVAKGVRKSQARLAASLENFNLVSFTIVGKGGAKKITNSIVEENFQNIRNNYDLLESVFQSMKIINGLVEKEEKDEQLFQYLADYLYALNSLNGKLAVKNELISEGFIFKVLDKLGYRFEIKRCNNCQGKLIPGNNYFSFYSGGIVCGKCLEKNYDCLKVSDNTIKLIRIFYQNNLKSLIKITAGNKEIAELKNITGGYLRWIAK
jgi:DNA repair protein RecO (recombination protein O)